MKRLIYVSPVPWNSFAQRPHKFVEWFHSKTGGDVLWVDPYPTRLPALKDASRLWNGLGREPARQKKLPNWIQVIKPRALPIEPLPGSGWINELGWKSVIANAENFAHHSDAILVIGKPSVLAIHLVKKLPKCKSVFDAMDDFPEFYTGLSRFAMKCRQNMLAKMVNTVWASSTDLKQKWAMYCSNVLLVLNGFDPTVQPCSSFSKGNGSRLIFGYVGTIAAWFDWDWINEIAEARPFDEIQLIGPVYSKPASKLKANVKVLPECSHQQAINRMASFDIALIPFKSYHLTDCVDPIKYYEYRALGLPVISTSFGEMRYRKDDPGVFISQSLYDIKKVLGRALAHLGEVNMDRTSFIENNNWDARFRTAGLL